jgi:hypothetical protein
MNLIPDHNRAFALRLTYYFCILLLSAFSLFILWENRFLPLQDYPQHLFIAFASATADNPDYNWQLYFDINQKFGPYSICYLLIGWLTNFMSIEAAGKGFVSLILIMYTLFALTEPIEDDKPTPWPLLLLFPVFFNQIFYFGFLNYLLALPILLFTLRSTSRFSEAPNSWIRLSLLGVLLLFLALSHPYIFILYLLFGGVFLYNNRTNSVALSRMFVLYFLAAVVFAVWLLSVPDSIGSFSARWMPFWEGSMSFISLLFTGMSISNGVDWLSLILWALIIFAITLGYLRRPNILDLSKTEFALLVISILLYCCLPFYFGHYSYFNLRLAPVIYLIAILLIRRISLAPSSIGLVLVSSLALLVIAHQRHVAFDEEAASIIPILDSMQPNSRILPIYRNASSAYFDPKFYYQIHEHDHFYYHTLNGGGFSPNLFSSPLIPVQYNAVQTNKNKIANSGTLESLVSDFDYVLIRNPRPEDLKYIRGAFQQSAESGPWVVFKSREFKKFKETEKLPIESSK